MEDNIKEIPYGFVDNENILRHVFYIKENDYTTIDRLKLEFSSVNAYPINFEKETAEIGTVYWNQNRFMYPSPFPSWIFDEELNNWVPPIPMPDSSNWKWDEETVSWLEIEKNTTAPQE